MEVIKNKRLRSIAAKDKIKEKDAKVKEAAAKAKERAAKVDAIMLPPLTPKNEWPDDCPCVVCCSWWGKWQEQGLVDPPYVWYTCTKCNNWFCPDCASHEKVTRHERNCILAGKPKPKAKSKPGANPKPKPKSDPKTKPKIKPKPKPKAKPKAKAKFNPKSKTKTKSKA
jgi:hypothetical protein